MSSTNLSDNQFFRVLAHEFVHSIEENQKSFGMFFDNQKFIEEWDSIQDGYARECGMTNRTEDIATVNEGVVIAFLEGRDINSIRPIDWNYEAFYAKIRLLKKYNFLPPVI